jgi:hypothetical protein
MIRVQLFFIPFQDIKVTFLCYLAAHGVKLAYSGRSDIFGINSDQLDEYQRGDFDRYFSAAYNAEEHRRSGRDIVRVIIKGNIFKQAIDTVIPPTSCPSQP